ncbi:MAG TPA: gephyrin-like molybdotransferase Glp [Gemmatimonadales bacterium]|nr:gephyrin-like molybdotransferase Glp [Gemmatimonadales bacterium]
MTTDRPALAAEEAARLILSQMQPRAPVHRALADCRGLALAEDVLAPIDVPPWDNSAMDGYAARGEDLRAGATLRVIEEVPAGRFPQKKVGSGEATRLFTGAPIPDGADTVIRQEDTTARAGTVEIVVPPASGRNIRKRGEDLTKGSTAVAKGLELTPARLGVLASVAHADPLVYPAPRVALLASGDEVVKLDRRQEILSGKKIASSNTYALAAAITEAGGVPVDLGIASDATDDVKARLAASRDVDLIVTTAGVSVGDHDLVRDAVTALGGIITFSRVRIRPGGPLNFGSLNGVPWIGLPGNPVSSLVTFELFARPAIRRLAGHRLPFRRAVPVVTSEALSLGPPLRHFLRVTLSHESTGLPKAHLTGSQSSGVLSSMAKADALLIVPEDRPDVPAGAELRAIVLDDPMHVREPAF